MTARIEKIVTSGTFSLDGQDFDVDNNVWLIGDDREVIVVDAAHDADAVVAAAGGRRLAAVVCTHGHNDHVNAAAEVARQTGAPILLHRADEVLWQLEYPDRTPDEDLSDRLELQVAGISLQVMHTPGHSPGSVSLYAPELGVLFSGDTLFNGGPGATGRSYSDEGQILTSIRTKLLALPEETVVHTGHGDDTLIAAEAPGLTDAGS